MMNTKEHIINEMVKLLKDNPADEALFFEEEKNYKWLEHLVQNGFFKIEGIKPLVQEGNTYYYPGWPQGIYIENIAKQIYAKTIIDEGFINSFVELLRSFYVVKDNLWAIRAIFRSIYLVPVKFLEVTDVLYSFNMIEAMSKRNDFIELDLHESYFHILETTSDNENERSILKEYTKCLLRSRIEEDFGFRERKLIFFKEYRFKHFVEKFYENQSKVSDYILNDTIEVVNSLLVEHLRGKDVDKTSTLWRPAVEPHAQNKFHDSAPSVFTGILYELSSILLERGKAPVELAAWKASSKIIFTRIYIALASRFPLIISPNECARRIIGLGLRSDFRHEMFQFLKDQFENLSIDNQNLILESIEGLTDKYSEDDDARKPLFTAWKKMRWLQAIKNSTNEKARNLYQEVLVITNSEADHPDFDSYVGPTWVGPTSPLTLDEFNKFSPTEIIQKLLDYKDKKDRFGEPSSEGLSRTFEEFVANEPVKSSALIANAYKLPFTYLSSLFDGYTKCWVDKSKQVPARELLDLALSIVRSEAFINEVSDVKSKARWTANSIFRFVSSGVRDDKNAFDADLNPICYQILRTAVDVVKPSQDYKGSSDAQTRAINEPRGVLFETAILLALREARIINNVNKKSSKETEHFKKIWANLYSIIGPPLEAQNISEVSLHAHLGSLYRQILFLNHEWLLKNIDLVCPLDPSKVDLWSAFMQGFCYVNVNVKEVYQILNEKGHLQKFLRYTQESESKSSSRIDTLQERIIALALISYVLKTESLKAGLLKEILDFEDPDEWNRMIHFIPQIVGKKPTKSILEQAKKLMAYIVNKFDLIDDKLSWKKHFASIGWVLPIFNDPNDPLVEKIIKIEAFYTNDYWDHHEIVNYLEPLKDSHTEKIGSLFLELINGGKGYPGYPEDKIKAICSSLKKNGHTALLADICTIYARKSPHSSLTREIFKIMES